MSRQAYDLLAKRSWMVTGHHGSPAFSSQNDRATNHTLARFLLSLCFPPKLAVALTSDYIVPLDNASAANTS